MACNLFRIVGKVTPGVFFEACLLRAKKRIGDAHQTNVMMPAQPLAAFVMIQSQFFFQFPVIQLHAPAGLGDADQAPQPGRLRVDLSQPVLWLARSIPSAIPAAATPPREADVPVSATRVQPKPGSWRNATVACPGFLDAKPPFARPNSAAARPRLAGFAVAAVPPAGDTSAAVLFASVSARADWGLRSKPPWSALPVPHKPGGVRCVPSAP